MFGKHFASMYSGSMFGQPALVFAVMGYVIATMRPSRKDGQCYVELNPTLLGATFSSAPDAVLEAVRTLASPDERSRGKSESGRRLVFLGEEMTLGPMQFRVVNGAHYRAMRDEEERRVYLREAKRRERSSRKSTKSTAVNRRQPRTTQAEAEAEAEADDGKNVIATPSAPPSLTPTKTQPKPSWSREACEAWIERFSGTAPGGQIGKALAPLVKAHGWEEVSGAWDAYLAQVDPQYASPSRFSATYGQWAKSARPSPPPGGRPARDPHLLRVDAIEAELAARRAREQQQ